MIGYDRLGTNGRFGNQLFQFAALRGIAAHHGYDWCIPPDEHQTFANYGIHHAFALESMTEKNIGFINSNVSFGQLYSFEDLKFYNPNVKNVTEKCFKFDEDLFYNFEDNANLDGYLQTEKYFKHIEDDLKKDLRFKDEILKPCEEFISQFDKIVFLHVRRCDAVGREDYYCAITLDYYKKALEYFDDDAYVFVCSDDVEWCLKQEFFNSDRFLINTNVETYDTIALEGDGKYRKSPIPYTDLCLMSLCSGGIIPISTFGWWGAWLQKDPNKIIVAPKNWFGPKLSNNDISDLIPNEWIKIEN